MSQAGQGRSLTHQFKFPRSRLPSSGKLALWGNNGLLILAVRTLNAFVCLRLSSIRDLADKRIFVQLVKSRQPTDNCHFHLFSSYSKFLSSFINLKIRFDNFDFLPLPSNWIFFLPDSHKLNQKTFLRGQHVSKISHISWFFYQQYLLRCLDRILPWNLRL